VKLSETSAKPSALRDSAPLKDDVSHLAAAAATWRGLLAQDPADSVADVGFAAAIGTDDGGDAFVEIKDRFYRANDLKPKSSSDWRCIKIGG